MSTEGQEQVGNETTQTTGGDAGGAQVEHGDGGGEQATGSAPDWKPSFKFKVYDKEMDFPEDLRGYVKDANTEKRFRELLEKSHALDEHKTIHQKVLQNLDEYKGRATDFESKYNQAVDGLRRLYGYSQKDLGQFFDFYKIPKEKVIQFVREQLEEEELPDQEKQRRSEWRQRSREADFYQYQLQQEKAQNESLVMSQHNAAMEMAVHQPDVREFAASFDSKFGQGAFRQHVTDYGAKVYNSQQKYISPFEAVKAVMEYYRPGFQSATPNPSQQETGEKPPTIPNVGSGKGVSPTRQRFKNLDQLKKFVKENYQEA